MFESIDITSVLLGAGATYFYLKNKIDVVKLQLEEEKRTSDRLYKRIDELKQPIEEGKGKKG